MTDFVDRLRKAAAYALIGDSQAEIAQALDVTRQTVNVWFVRGGTPEADLIFWIAERFGVDARWLKTGDGAMIPEAATTPLSTDERELVKNYRSATPMVRAVISSMTRAACKVAVNAQPIRKRPRK